MKLTQGTTADCTQALELIEGLAPQALLADKAYDTNAIVEELERREIEIVIPPKNNRKEKRKYDEALYKLRHLVENTFLHLKRWRSIATRYAKTTASFMAECQIAALFLWLS